MSGQNVDVEDDSTDDVIDPVDPVDPIDPIDPVDPVGPNTLGATFSETDDGVTIEFGENETSSLAVITYVDIRVDDESSGYLATHEARYYLVPDGVDWPDNTSETAGDVPGERDFGGHPTYYSLSDFEEHFGLTLLGTHDLLAQGDTSASPENMRDGLPELTANRDAEYYYLESDSDNIDLSSYLQEDYLVTRNGVTETLVTEDTIGSDGIDWLTADAGGVTVNGAAGDDVLLSNAANVTLQGGDGNDTLDSDEANVVFEGGDGDDVIDAHGDAIIYGGDGDDRIRGGGLTIDGGAGDDHIYSYEEFGGREISGGAGEDNIMSAGGAVYGGVGNDNIEIAYQGGTAYGDEGDDRLETNYASGSELYGGVGDDVLYDKSGDSDLFGGEGNDILTARSGSTADGGAGNDAISVYASGTAIGGDGDDTITYTSHPYNDGDETAFAEGGAGADTFQIDHFRLNGTPPDDIYLQINDFDPDENILRVRPENIDGTDVSDISVHEDAGGGFTDIVVSYAANDSDATFLVIRLDGTTGVTADQIVLG